jgi:hypothetical protein
MGEITWGMMFSNLRLAKRSKSLFIDCLEDDLFDYYLDLESSSNIAYFPFSTALFINII